MTPFTDEQLKRLKEWAYDKPEILSLIARLEAAERLIEACGQDINVSKQYEAWRRSKGEINVCDHTCSASKNGAKSAMKAFDGYGGMRPCECRDSLTCFNFLSDLTLELSDMKECNAKLQAENERYRKALEDIKQLRHFFGGDKRVKFSECLDIAKSALEGNE